MGFGKGKSITEKKKKAPPSKEKREHWLKLASGRGSKRGRGQGSSRGRGRGDSRGRGRGSRGRGKEVGRGRGRGSSRGRGRGNSRGRGRGSGRGRGRGRGRGSSRGRGRGSSRGRGRGSSRGRGRGSSRGRGRERDPQEGGVKRKVDWAEVKGEAKERKKKRVEKLYGEDGATVVSAMNKVWGSSFATMNKKQKAEKCEQCYKVIKSKIKEIASRKSASRTLQLLIKHSRPEQNELIAKELVGEVLTLSKDQNGHHVILKLVMYGNMNARKQICEEILKEVMLLAGNRFGCMVLDRILVNPECVGYRKLILQQVYSKAYAVMPLEDKDKNPLDLQKIIEANPEQKRYILENMAKFLENQLSKTPSLVLVQVVLLKYLNHCSSDERKKILEMMVPVCGELFTSKDGQLAVVKALDKSSAKQRKKILQQLREHVVEMCKDEAGVLILLRALDVTDDTVLTSKIILKPLLAELPSLFVDKSTARVSRSRLCFLHVLCPRSERYFKPKILKYLPKPILIKDDPANFNSKKSNEVKQKEQMSQILPGLITYCQEHFASLLTQHEPLLYQTCVQCFGTMVPKVEEGTKLLTSIVEHALGNLKKVMDHAVSHRRLRGLAELCPPFCDILIERLSEEQILSVCSTRGAIVLVRCLQKSLKETTSSKLKEVIKKNMKKLKDMKGKSLQILLEEIEKPEVTSG